MALTDTSTETAGSDAVTSPTSVPAPVTVLGSGDHKTIGVVYVVAALLMGIGAWVISALATADLIGDDGFLSETAAVTMSTLGRAGLVLLVIVPLFLGLATYIVPLQVGANTVAFPRASASALWLWLLSAGLLIVANAIDGGFAGTRERAVDLGLLAMLGLILALVIGTMCVLTTIIALRTPGMRIDRVPLFSFAMFAAGSVWVITLPVLAANVILIYVDSRYGSGESFADAATRWTQLSWITTQPQVYVWLVPGLGLALDVVATFVGVRQPQRNLLLVAVGALTILGVGAYAQTAFYPDVRNDAVWSAMALLALLPMLLVLGGVLTTLRLAKPRLTAALALCVVTVLLMVLGVIAGALNAINPLELRETEYFSIGQFMLIMAAAFTAGVAGVAYWAPKMTGRFPSAGAGLLAVPVLLGGGVLTGVPMLVIGFSTRFTGLADATDTLLVVAVVGLALMALGGLLALATLLSTIRGDVASDDAWGMGQSLEWSTTSPPALANFGEIPLVTSPQPLLDAAESKES